MKNIIIETLKHNPNYYRVVQGKICYEPLRIEEVFDLLRKLMRDFDVTDQLYEVFFDDPLQQWARRHYGWCVKAYSIEEALKKFDTYHDVKSIRLLDNDMPMKKWKVRYEFWGYSSPCKEKKYDICNGRTPAEAMYWFAQEFSNPLGTYTIEDVEEIEI